MKIRRHVRKTLQKLRPEGEKWSDTRAKGDSPLPPPPALLLCSLNFCPLPRHPLHPQVPPQTEILYLSRDRFSRSLASRAAEHPSGIMQVTVRSVELPGNTSHLKVLSSNLILQMSSPFDSDNLNFIKS